LPLTSSINDIVNSQSYQDFLNQNNTTLLNESTQGGQAAQSGSMGAESTTPTGPEFDPNNGDPVENLKKESSPGRQTKGPSRQYEKPGGMEQANKDFNRLGPKNIQEYPNGTRVGDLPGGGKVNVRPISSDGRPTLEIQKGTKIIKFRYNG